MAENVDTISQEAALSSSDCPSRNACSDDVAGSLLESAWSIPECIPRSLRMVVLRMHELAEKKGLVGTSISILSLIIVLLVMTSVSGGVSGLSCSFEARSRQGGLTIPDSLWVLGAFCKYVDAS